MKKQLENIYNAKQCTDLNDVNIAIEQTKEVIKQYPGELTPVKRLASLEKRKSQLEAKSL